MLIKRTIGKHSNMLLVGEGATSFGIGDIVYEDNYDHVLKKYGKSELSDAFKIAKDYGVKDVFLMNVKTSSQYLEHIKLLKDYDFTYIVPVSVYISDTMNDPYNNNAEYSYITYILSMISDSKSESVIIATDKHASLYEDMDIFIEDMNFAASYITDGSTNRMKLNNVIFVANNLEETEHANVYLASVLCTIPLSKYPEDEFGKTIFDIDSWDGLKNVAYFKPHTDGSVTIENLLNFEKGGPLKIVYIDRIIKALSREIEFNEFIGKGYTEYRRVRIQEKLAKYLEDQIGKTIYDFNINSVYATKTKQHPGTVTVYCDFSVWPLNCIAECRISKEIEI